MGLADEGKQSTIIRGPMILEKTKKFSDRLGIPDFEPNNDYLLGQWKVNESSMVKEVLQVRLVMQDELRIGCLPYMLIMIHNTGESTLFYKALPSETFTTAGDKPESGRTKISVNFTVSRQHEWVR